MKKSSGKTNNLSMYSSTQPKNSSKRPNVRAKRPIKESAPKSIHEKLLDSKALDEENKIGVQVRTNA